jgi:hypothetical protein
MGINEQCSIKWVSDGKDWKLVLKGECSKVVAQIDALPKRKMNYLKRRTEVDLSEGRLRPLIINPGLFKLGP